MQNLLPYLTMPIMAFILVAAQALWGTAIKGRDNVLKGSLTEITINLLTNWRMWAGALLYIMATLLYFYMLSKLKFFSVQVAMTGLSIIFSVGLSIILFHEKPGLVNIIGILLVLLGVALVLQK